NGGYTQDDVRALAHILTGWSVDIAGGRAFVFRPRAHERDLNHCWGRLSMRTANSKASRRLSF
ncbi:MAG: DUF1800 domain-containing protein, partial [Brachymonas sp.]|nr:DUF1800 domain-containing protein [Brachymonas sp.]